MGYICWGEFGDWGWDWNEGELTPAGAYQPGLSLVEQWQRVLERDYNHPAIIGWCPLNETHLRKVANESSMKLLDDLTKADAPLHMLIDMLQQNETVDKIRQNMRRPYVLNYQVVEVFRLFWIV